MPVTIRATIHIQRHVIILQSTAENDWSANVKWDLTRFLAEIPRPRIHVGINSIILHLCSPISMHDSDWSYLLEIYNETSHVVRLAVIKFYGW